MFAGVGYNSPCRRVPGGLGWECLRTCQPVLLPELYHKCKRANVRFLQVFSGFQEAFTPRAQGLTRR